MKNRQYVIKRLDTGEYVKWGEDVILFDTQEEAEEMIMECPDPTKFRDPLNNVEICSGVFFIKNSKNHKEIKTTGLYSQLVKIYNSTPACMLEPKEEKRNG